MKLRTFLLITTILAGCANAQAADWYTGGSPASAERKTDNDWIVALDASLTVTSKSSVFGNLTGTFAAFSTLQTSGARIRVDGLAGSYNYQTNGAAPVWVRVRQEAASLLGGYEWVSKNATFAVFIGGNFSNTSLSVADPTNTVQGSGAGFKISGEYYANPTTKTMVSAYASYASLHNSYYARVKGGWSVFNKNTFLGPEVIVVGDDFTSQYRVGAHLTGMKMGPMQFGLSGGYLNDRIRGSGTYAIMDARVGF